ncbi:MAG: carbohydrate ABC transporter permease [Chloroflexota bacterium]
MVHGGPGQLLRDTLTFRLPLALFVIALLFPFYWMLLTSVKTDGDLYNLSNFPLFLNQMPTLEHYNYLFSKTPFLRWAGNTLLIATVSTTISLISGIMAGYALARLQFRGVGMLGTIIFVTYLVPQTLLFMPMTEVIHAMGLQDSYWALMLTYPTFLIPFATWLLASYFKTIPVEMEECAMIDGASRLRAMVSIVLPLSIPGILSAGIFAFTLSWNEFIYALIFLSSSDLKTIPVGVVVELIRGDVYFWGSLMAGALLGSVPVAIVYSFFVEHYVAGLTAGAVKG